MFFFVIVRRIVTGLDDGFNLKPSRWPLALSPWPFVSISSTSSPSPRTAFPYKTRARRETAALHPTWKGRFMAGSNPGILLWERMVVAQ
jgi:hypothetical protein